MTGSALAWAGYGDSYGYSCSDGDGYGHDDGYSDGYSYGDGDSNGDGHGDYGYGIGNGYGNGYGDGHSDGYSYGDGDGDSFGDCCSNGCGHDDLESAAPLPARITSAVLRRAKACQNHVDLFAATFPDGAIYPRDIDRARSVGLDVEWAQERLALVPVITKKESRS